MEEPPRAQGRPLGTPRRRFRRHLRDFASNLRIDALRVVRRAHLWLAPMSAPLGAPRQIHLSWSGDPRTSLDVFWHTSGRRNPAVVAVRAEGASHWREIEGSSRMAPGFTGTLHHAVVRGLEAGTCYEYRVSADRGIEPAWGRPHEVRTGPEPNGPPVRVVFFCDIGLAGRPDATADAADRVRDEISRDEPLALLGGGDYVSAHRDARFRDPALAIDAWFDAMEPLLARVPLMAQLGNHEVSLAERLEDWAPRLSRLTQDPRGCSYSFDLGGAHFSALYAPGQIPDASHLRWLEEDLESPTARRAAWRIVYQHAPVFASGRSHPAHSAMRTALAPILERHGVDLHLSGHDQSYERTYPLRGAFGESPERGSASRDRTRAGDGVVYAKVSPAGKLSDRGRDWSRFDSPREPWVAARNDADHHYGILDVSERVLRVEIAGLPDTEGPRRLVDTFSIER